jgi:thiosulfate/3-mercaptopyruvate sulfurtransferase
MTLMMKRVISLVVIVALFTVLVGCNKTEFIDSERLIEASDLEVVLSDADTIVIDARGVNEYEKGHLEGAINLPPSELTLSTPVTGSIADKATVEAVLSAKGISNDSKVYIYDNNDGIYAARVWWVLKVYGHEFVKVINGGQDAIVKAELPLSAETTILEATSYKAFEMDTVLYASIDDVVGIVEDTAEGCILDVRSQTEYDEGSIPGAILYPHTKNLYTDGTFRSARDTYLNYNDLGLSKDETIIVYCKTSVRAAQTAILLLEAGYEDVRVYDGAWLEWSTKDMPKEEPTEQVAPTTTDAS